MIPKQVGQDFDAALFSRITVSSGVEDIVKLALASVRSIKHGESQVEESQSAGSASDAGSLTEETKEIPQSGEIAIIPSEHLAAAAAAGLS